MKKRYLVGVLSGLMMLTVVGCGGSKYGMDITEELTMDAASGNSMMAESPAETAKWDYDAELDSGGENGTISSENGIEPVIENGRKLIKNVSLDLQTKEFDTLIENLIQKVQEMGGYIESSSIWGNNYYNNDTRSANYTARIPSDRLDEFVEVAGELGNVTYKNESVEDVTLQYVDTESRKKALETEQERLLQLLEQADNLEDLLTIESRLSEVRYQLENYGSQLRILDNQVDYSTVYLNISEVERITEIKERGFFEEVAAQFSNSLYIVGSGLRGFAIGFLGSLPILAVWAIVLAGIVLIIRKIFYRKKKPRNFRKKEEPPQDNTPMNSEE